MRLGLQNRDMAKPEYHVKMTLIRNVLTAWINFKLGHVPEIIAYRNVMLHSIYLIYVLSSFQIIGFLHKPTCVEITYKIQKTIMSMYVYKFLHSSTQS